MGRSTCRYTIPGLLFVPEFNIGTNQYILHPFIFLFFFWQYILVSILRSVPAILNFHFEYWFQVQNCRCLIYFGNFAVVRECNAQWPYGKFYKIRFTNSLQERIYSYERGLPVCYHPTFANCLAWKVFLPSSLHYVMSLLIAPARLSLNYEGLNRWPYVQNKVNTHCEQFSTSLTALRYFIWSILPCSSVWSTTKPRK
jgi:hypothetical protein